MCRSLIVENSYNKGHSIRKIFIFILFHLIYFNFTFNLLNPSTSLPHTAGLAFLYIVPLWERTIHEAKERVRGFTNTVKLFIFKMTLIIKANIIRSTMALFLST